MIRVHLMEYHLGYYRCVSLTKKCDFLSLLIRFNFILFRSFLYCYSTGQKYIIVKKYYMVLFVLFNFVLSRVGKTKLLKDRIHDDQVRNDQGCEDRVRENQVEVPIWHMCTVV